MLIRIARGDDARRALAEVTRALGTSAGMVSEASRDLTRKVFGQDLTPQEVVRRIVADVRDRGDQAVLDYARRLDGVELSADRLRVSAAELAQAHAAAPPRFLEAVRRAAGNVRDYQEHFMIHPPPPLRPRPGVTLNMRFTAMQRAGIYVPGGRATLPSSVIMTAVPAQVAGVGEIAMATPCAPDGTVPPLMLATARELGLDEVYRVGGAQAVAAMAFGTHSIPRVDKIVGPGNIYVALAKKEVFSAVDIDMIAGPSEILIIADETASPALCAADMLGQAEHDPGAAVLLTPSGDLANDTAAELERQLAGLGRAEAARRSLERYGLIGVVRDLAECVELANMVAPEHVEVMTREPHDVLPHLRHCGAVFLGDSTPEAVGDYVAGPSHVLPTGGTARFFSGLSFLDFLKRTSVIEYSRRALAAEAEDIVALADAEGLGAHARSAWLRLEGEAKA